MKIRERDIDDATAPTIDEALDEIASEDREYLDMLDIPRMPMGLHREGRDNSLRGYEDFFE